jgi:hypothetical protein
MLAYCSLRHALAEYNSLVYLDVVTLIRMTLNSAINSLQHRADQMQTATVSGKILYALTLHFIVSECQSAQCCVACRIINYFVSDNDFKCGRA